MKKDLDKFKLMEMTWVEYTESRNKSDLEKFSKKDWCDFFSYGYNLI